MVTITVKVRPNARNSTLEEQPDGTFVASVKAPPVDGRANVELCALVARRFGVPQSAVHIKTGAGARHKRVTVVRE